MTEGPVETGPPERGQATTIHSAARALRLLHHLVRAPQGKRLIDLSREIELPEVTTLRLLQTFIREGVVRRDPERGHYRLSPRFWLGAVAAFPDVREARGQLTGSLEELARRTRGCVALAVPYPGLRKMGLVAVAEPPGAAAAPVSRAMNLPMHACAAGKCYLAWLPEETLRAWVEGELPALTPRTVRSAPALLRELERVRADGYALDRGECLPGCTSLAVPLRDSDGVPSGALQLSAPGGASGEAALRAWLPALQMAARVLSASFSSLAQLG